MNKASNKLAAGVRKVKGQDKRAATQPEVAQPSSRDNAARRATAPKAQPGTIHPDRVWPD